MSEETEEYGEFLIELALERKQVTEDFEHALFRCAHCGEKFCPDCDLPAGVKDVIDHAPVWCGLCLDVNTSLHTYANMILDRLEAKKGGTTQ